jgi:hypothetical protein
MDNVPITMSYVLPGSAALKRNWRSCDQFQPAISRHLSTKEHPMRKTLPAALTALGAFFAVLGLAAPAAADPTAHPTAHPEGDHHDGDKGGEHHEGDHHEAEKPAH